MTDILIKIIPLDLAATLSPGILALTLVVLASKNHPKAHILSMLAGALMTGVGITIIGFVLGNTLNTGLKQTATESIVDIILGLLFIIYGLKLFLQKERKINLDAQEEELKIFKWFGLGLVITITNFDALFLTFTAAKEVGSADNILTIDRWILLIINILFFILPITLPLLLKLIFPKTSAPILAKINGFVTKYSRYIILAMFFIFGIFLLYKGIIFFLK